MRKYCKPLFLTMFLMLFLLFNSTVYADSIPLYSSIQELEGKTIGYNVGTVDDITVKDKIPDTKSLYFNSVTDRLAALESGKIDATIGGEPAMRRAMKQHPVLAVIPDPIAYSDYGYAFAKGSPLTARFDEVIKELESDGTLSAAWNKWVEDYAAADMARKQRDPSLLDPGGQRTHLLCRRQQPGHGI